MAATYALDNDHHASTQHHDYLADAMDAGTRARIVNLPVWPHTTRCLEIGAGGGSISRWLADQMPTGGSVTALDIKPGPIGTHPRLHVVEHDLTGPTRLESVVTPEFDLIVARMVLLHLPNRHEVVNQLVALLRPGGYLLVEDWVVPDTNGLAVAPTSTDKQLWHRFRTATARVFDSAGADRHWGLHTWSALHEVGLVDLSTVITGEYWRGGHPGLRLVATAAAQLAPKLIDFGLTREELARVEELTRDPETVAHGYPMYSTAGRRPVQ